MRAGAIEGAEKGQRTTRSNEYHNTQGYNAPLVDTTVCHQWLGAGHRYLVLRLSAANQLSQHPEKRYTRNELYCARRPLIKCSNGVDITCTIMLANHFI